MMAARERLGPRKEVLKVAPPPCWVVAIRKPRTAAASSTFSIRPRRRFAVSGSRSQIGFNTFGAASESICG